MENGNGRVIQKINGARSIFFDRMPDGTWTAKTDRADGEIAATGASIREARLALDELLRDLPLVLEELRPSGQAVNARESEPSAESE